MNEPMVKLAGKCVLHVDTGTGTSKVEVPKKHYETGENNADGFINEVLHFAIMRHGKTKLREMLELKLGTYGEEFENQGLQPRD